MTDVSTLRHSVKESEERLLSAILYNPDEALSKISVLHDEMFSVPKYGNIYTELCRMVEADESVDYITLANNLQWATPTQLDGMINKFILGTSFVQTDVRIINNAYRKRRMASTMEKIIADSHDSEEMLSLLQDELDSLNDIGDATDETLKSQAEKWSMGLEEALNNGGTTGIQSHFTPYNQMTGGYKDSHLVVVGARPKVGKSTYALNEAYQMALKGIPTLLISLEMGFDEIITKLAGIDSNLKGLNFLTPEKLSRVFEVRAKIEGLPLYIVDNSSSDYRAVLNKCRQMIRKHNVQAIYIDYLQLMTGNTSLNRNNEISEITRSIKQFNRKYKVPIILLSQLSRLSEREGNREPRFSDLRDSGSIEQDANVIVFLHAPDGAPDDVLNVVVAGCRGGSTGFFGCRFDKPASRMDAIDNRRDDGEY